jgi:Predicted nucleic acid-binding protein, contains PIN domain
MPYLIDSDIVIDHLANVQAANQLLEDLAPEGIAISIITYMEAYQGVSRNPHSQIAQKQFQAFLETVPVLPFSLSVAQRCALLRERLKQEGKRVKARALDVMNAAIALEHHLELVTRNREDYEDIPDLLLYKIPF